MKCPSCSKRMFFTAKFCSRCGTRLSPEPAEKRDREVAQAEEQYPDYPYLDALSDSVEAEHDHTQDVSMELAGGKGRYAYIAVGAVFVLSVVIALVVRLSNPYEVNGNFSGINQEGGQQNESIEKNIIYMKNTAGWDKVYCYMWEEDGLKNQEWPGIEMTEIEEGVFYYATDVDFPYVIFSDGHGEQTVDLLWEGNGSIFDNYTNKFEYGVDSGKNRIYMANTAGWKRVFCYMWMDTGYQNKDWPGVEMTEEEPGVFCYVTDLDFPNVIFNDGSGIQTEDLKWEGNDSVFDNTTSTFRKR